MIDQAARSQEAKRGPFTGFALFTAGELSSRRKSTPALRSAICDRKPGPCQAGRSLTDGNHSAIRRLAQGCASLMSDTFSRYDWERWVRRCILPSSVKLVALAMATYAARDGSRVFPGVKRLAAVTQLSERTVRTALGQLREVGLIERIADGGRRGTLAFADVHRLAIPVDLLDRIPTLSPDEDAIPKRQPLPLGKATGTVPNRQLTTSQPATISAQPATDDIPTGNGCTPTDQLSLHRSDQGTTEGLPFGTRPTTGAATVASNNVIPFDRRAQ